MHIKAVIFDLGGVIVRTEDQGPRMKLAADLGMTYEELSDFIFNNETARLVTIGKLTTQEHWEAIRNALGMELDEFSRVPESFWAGDSVDYKLVAYLRSLRPRHKTGLLSNAWDDLRGVITDAWKFADAFDEMIISAEVGLAKPDPRIYKLAVERLQVAPSEAVFVDDFIENVEGAHAAGLRAIHFRGTDQALAELEQMIG